MGYKKKTCREKLIDKKGYPKILKLEKEGFRIVWKGKKAFIESYSDYLACKEIS